MIFYENECDPHDELRLAASFRDFVSMLGPEPGDVMELDPTQVESVWIDPEFAKEHGLKPPGTEPS